MLDTRVRNARLSELDSDWSIARVTHNRHYGSGPEREIVLADNAPARGP
jgi:hypothetical protein